MNHPWSPADMPSQSGKRIVITGANSGIGWHAALELARAGAEVVLPVRSQAKADDTTQRIRAEVPEAKLVPALMDLTSLASVRAFADQLLADGKPIDVLINNAGVMAVPQREVTVDGYERQFATNVVGHFLLTALLLPAVLRAPQPRVVTVASSAHVGGGPVPIPDLNAEQSYSPTKAYAKTKLENVLFAQELQKRAGTRLLSASCHPGFARTNLQFSGTSVGMKIMCALLLPFSQGAARGAEPTLYVATAADVKPGGYYGPRRLRGPVQDVRMADFAYDTAAAAQLFDQLEKMVGVKYAL